MVYCAGKPIEISRAFRDVGRTLEEFVNHSPAARDLQILLFFFQHPARFNSL